ncbi:MAG: ParB N-terminal domain-containing protein [Candidatus Sulfotelmatobacter sp.]|jgi:ParB family chromosome partitioning protein
MVKRAPARRRPRKAKPGTKGLGPAECRLDQPTGAAAKVAEAIEKAGGCVVGSYKEPLAGHPVLLSVLPIDAVEPTPFQRDLSDAHHKRLADVINKTGRFLDPIIAVVAPKGGFWTPNGRHRLEAMRRLGAKSITALVVADREIAWQILALNTEKAHNLKERSLEVIRIYRGLVDEDATRSESQFTFYLDEPALVTLGICYERFPRFGGGAYHSILRRLEAFTDEPLRAALKDHEKRATMVLDLEEKVAAAVKKLKERGLVSPYLRSFVVARINPLRWIKGNPPPLEDVLKTMRERAARFNVEKIRPQDLAGAAGPPDEET